MSLLLLQSQFDPKLLTLLQNALQLSGSITRFATHLCGSTQTRDVVAG